MANWSDPRLDGGSQSTATVGRAQVAVDAGLRSHMLSVYNYMASGVLLTGIVALLLRHAGMAAQIFVRRRHPQMGDHASRRCCMVLALSFGINRMSTGTAQALYWAFAARDGPVDVGDLLIYTGRSIAMTFFATAAAFASLSLWGYTTKKDLSGFGTFLIMGVVGLIVAMIVNIFIRITIRWSLVISVDRRADLRRPHRLRHAEDQEHLFRRSPAPISLGKAAIMGALTLYLDFINMFLFLLRFLGSRD